MGLALVRRLCDAHGATVKAARSDEKGGSTFTILWPLSPTCSQSPRRRRCSSRPSRPREPDAQRRADVSGGERGEGGTASSNRQPILEDDAVGAHRGDPRPGQQDAREIKRVGGGDAHDFRRTLATAHAAQLINGFGKRVLLSRETGDEASTARGAARFHAAQRPDDVAPRQGDRLARYDVAEDHAPAHQQLLGDRLGERIVLVDRRRARHQRPAALARRVTADAMAQAAAMRPRARQAAADEQARARR